MNIICADFESLWDDNYTLKKMTVESYVRDPRFQALGCAVRDQQRRWLDYQEIEPHTVWIPHDQLPEFLRQYDWADTAIVAHHAQFDGFILSHHYDVRPKFWFCTLSMARLLLGNHLSVGLDSLAKHFSLAAKNVPYTLFKGRSWDQLGPDIQRQVATGACHDVALTWQIFNLLRKSFPHEEYQVVDTTCRMFTEPCLRGDIELLADLWEEEDRAKKLRLERLDISAAQLASADQFAALLVAEGIEPETKAGKNGPIYAFAKTDEFMEYLLEHDSERVRTLAEARLNEKSTLLQTRAETLGWMARRGPMPVYLRYAGTGTLRPSGGDKANFLNLKRRSPIRRAIKAPEGFLLAPVDASQIECRCLHFLAGGPNEPVVVKFRNGEDPYIDISSQFYGEKIYKPKSDDPRKDEMEAKRGMGKQARLMCGYGAAGPKFKATAKHGLYGPPVEISLIDANAFVELYRQTNPSICGSAGYWRQGDWALNKLAHGASDQWGPLAIKNKRFYLPEGQPVIYDTLEWHIPDSDEECRDFEHSGYWRMKTRYGWKKMWGSKIVQNVCEAVSRVIVSQAMARIARMNYRILNWPYDELLVLIPRDGREVKHAERCAAEMRVVPEWLKGLPLDAEYTIGDRYLK